MQPRVLISDLFLGSIRNLSRTDAQLTFAFLKDFSTHPNLPGHSLERVRNSRDKNVWSARINDDLRAILWKGEGKCILLHANKHDDAYRWAKKIRVTANFVACELQIWVATTHDDIVPATPAEVGAAQPVPLFPKSLVTNEQLVHLGIPEDSLNLVRMITSQDCLEDASNRLPEQAWLRLIELDAGKNIEDILSEMNTPVDTEEAVLAKAIDDARLFDCPTPEQLDQLRQSPFDTWLVFISPEQRNLAEKNFDGPSKVTGSAGTGKTILAVHRAKHLASQGKRVLLTTFTRALAGSLSDRVQLCCAQQDVKQITTKHVHSVARALVPTHRIANDGWVKEALIAFATTENLPFTQIFLWDEWRLVIDLYGIESNDAYMKVERVGMKRPLSPTQRQQLWPVFSACLRRMEATQKTTWAGLCRKAADLAASGTYISPYDAVVADEYQNFGPAELQLLLRLSRPSCDLMLLGDAGQRIYSRQSSLRSLGIEVRGRSAALRTSYRSTREIISFASHLTEKRIATDDDEMEDRTITHTPLHGEPPKVKRFDRPLGERTFVCSSIRTLLQDRCEPEAIAITSRTNQYLQPFGGQLGPMNIPFNWPNQEPQDGQVRLLTMHDINGLEFRHVFVVGVSDDQIPSPRALEADDAGTRENARQRERNLLYVALTRARDSLTVTYCGAESPLLP